MKPKSLVRLLIAALIIALVVWFSDPASLVRITQVHPVPVILVLGLTALLASASTLRWRLILTWLQPEAGFPKLRIFRVVTLGLSLGLVVNQDIAAAGTRITYLNRGQQMSLEQASFSVFLDRWFDVLILISLAPVSGLFLAGLLPVIPSLALMVAMLAGLLTVGLLWPHALTHLFVIGFGLAVATLRRVLRRKGPALPLKLPQHTLTRAQLLQVLGLSLSRILVVGVRTWLVVLAIGIDLSLAETFLLIPVTQMAALIPLTPAGLGLFDAGWYGALLLKGVTPGDSLVFITLHRILTTFALLTMVAVTEVVWQTSRRLRRPVTQP